MREYFTRSLKQPKNLEPTQEDIKMMKSFRRGSIVQGVIAFGIIASLLILSVGYPYISTLL